MTTTATTTTAGRRSAGGVAYAIARAIFIAIRAVLRVVLWVPGVTIAKWLDEHWFSYVRQQVVRDARGNLVEVRFCHYGNPIFLFTMALVTYVIYCIVLATVPTFDAKVLLDAAQPANVITAVKVTTSGWFLFSWFVLLVLTYLALMTDVGWKELMWVIAVVAIIVLGSLLSQLQWQFNPLRGLRDHVRNIDVAVTPGFYLAVAELFTGLVCITLLQSWMYRRVKMDKSFVQMLGFPWGMKREQIYARPVERTSPDLIESILLLFGANVKVYLTGNRVLVFKNVPRAGRGRFADAIDALIDYKSGSEQKREADEAAAEVTMLRPEDAHDKATGEDHDAHPEAMPGHAHPEAHATNEVDVTHGTENAGDHGGENVTEEVHTS